MRIDDIKTYFVDHLATYIAARSTVLVPLYAIPSGCVWTRDYREPSGRVSLFLDDDPEEVNFLTTTTREIVLRVTAYVFVMQATEATMREQAGGYAGAIEDALADYEYFHAITARAYFDGVEANPGIKAAKLELEFRYEEVA